MVFALPNTANAGYISNTVMEVLLDIINFIINIIGWIVISTAASLLNYVFQFQSFTKVAVVQIGWTMSRDLANMGFILIMLAMAFGTILRIDTYGWKKLLPKLVMVALLINFSLIIAGIFIDMGNSLGLFFVSGGTSGEGANVGDFIMTAMQSGQWAQLRNDIGSVGSGITTLLMASVVQLVFYLIMAFLLMALAFIMIFRMINLWILLILAPLAWISYALPKFGSYWSAWWKKFLSWAFFPAVMGFFIFLGLLTGASFQGTEFGGPDVGSFWSIIFPETLFASVMQFIVVVGILFMGLAQAKKLGDEGTKMMMSGIGKAQSWGAGKLKGAGVGGFRAAKGLPMRAADKITDGAATRGLTTGREWLEKRAVIGRALGGPGAAFQRQQKMLTEEKGKLSKLRPQDLEAIIKQTAATPQGLARRAAALSTLADKNQLKDPHKAYLQSFVNSGGNMKDILDHRPDWAFDRNVQNIMAKNPSLPPQLKDQWKGIASEQNNDQMLIKVGELITTKLLGKAEDFAKIQKEAITQGMSPFADRLKGVLSDQFKEGGKLYTNHLNAMAGKNEESYHQIIQHLTKPDVKNTLKTQVQNHLTSNPGTNVMGIAPTAAPTTEGQATPP